MADLMLHHVSVIVTDLEKSLPFYRKAFGLTEIPRPPFSVGGAWLACGDLQVHLVVHPEGSFRTSPAVDRNDWHFAFHTKDFEGALQALEAMGFREDLAADDPRFMLVARTGIAGFPQLYIRDPDRNVIEINGAP